ncbi:hypothetical protein LCGC14_0209130 [marine sediment metagenome]|uniref:HNH domain-containing protein n=1 Tax=marine sediment metagenome TaxID=412755 RepID=A0A0F9UY39_9ZZZZ
MSDTKICTKCKCEHPLGYFAWQWQKKKPGKRRAWCKACNTESSSAWYLKNRARADARDTARRRADPAVRKAAVARKRQWRKDNPERTKTENRKYGMPWHRKHEKNRNKIQHYLEDKYTRTPCLDCGDTYDWVVMDFDHRPNESKGFTLSKHNSYKRTLENIRVVEEEIKVCDLVCSNCHRVRTHILRQHKTHNSPNARKQDAQPQG